jgi:hypothetical protein
MAENSKEAVWSGFCAGVEFVELRGSGGVVSASLAGDSESVGIVGVTDSLRCFLRCLAGWFAGIVCTWGPGQ